ncbi:hypothetical protein, partial [Saccharopolyspora shandongensis]|uniref:hypothetical protein n=1 Tax=Saccharopolyspora shandongensis TaxID=418495 RepID=UPI00340D6C19
PDDIANTVSFFAAREIDAPCEGVVAISREIAGRRRGLRGATRCSEEVAESLLGNGFRVFWWGVGGALAQ